MSGSSTMVSATSATVRSHSFPIETIFAKPIPRSPPREMKVPNRLPDCEMTEYPPAGNSGSSMMVLAVSASDGLIPMIPMQFGPIRRTPPARAISTISSCRARPFSPTSAKLAVKMVAMEAPISAQSRMMSGTVCGGVMIRTWSTGAVMSPTR